MRHRSGVALEKVPIDRETSMPWVEVAHSARLMADVLRQVDEPRAGSNFDQIAMFYPFERPFDWCKGYLAAALEHMEMWANYAAPLRFTPDAEVVHRFRPVQTLSRAAIESAAQAVWVMDGDSARECARRHLALVLHDLDEQARAAEGERKQEAREARRVVLSRLEGAIDEQGIGKFPGYMNIVKLASSVVAAKGSTEGGLGDSSEVERLWRASAGSSHGKRWPSVELQTILRAQSESEDTAGVRVPDPAAITKILKLADAVLTYGVLRFADFAGYFPELSSIVTNAMGAPGIGDTAA
jgi:hypothetical protein